MPEEQAFCVLAKVMYQYKMRNLFKNGFEDLHLKFFQLERLTEVMQSFEKTTNCDACISSGIASGEG